MRLAVNLGYWRTSADADTAELAVLAEDLGYSAAWVAEAHGSDAVSVLAWIAARTERIDLGSAILQIPARTPAMTAMTAATLDTLSQGRFLLGLGTSGPQVAEGWHGARFDHPLARTREYLDLIRLALSRKPLCGNGPHYPLHWPDGPDSALELTVGPYRGREIPIYLAAMGPKNLELTGAVADGWLSMFFSPWHAEQTLSSLRRAVQHAGRSMTEMDIVATMPLVVGENWRDCADAARPYAALFIGGMGTRSVNFYRDLVARMGFAEQAAEVHRLFMAQEYSEALAAVPAELLDATSLLGPKERIGERMLALAAAGVTTLAVSVRGQRTDRAAAALRTAAEALDHSGIGD
jgi:F420-dependent oxidoreductase-like protein